MNNAISADVGENHTILTLLHPKINVTYETNPSFTFNLFDSLY
jgi:hypothetical protein